MLTLILRSAALALGLAATAAAADDAETAIFAGGCFWCVESDFDKVDGVLETVSGYTGGDFDNPTYRQVVSGGTGHREAVRIVYDPARVPYARLVEILFRTIDPLDGGGQFCDRGFSYSPAVYAVNATQREIAEQVKAAMEAELGKETATPVIEASAFWDAEDDHQNYHQTNGIKYTFYRATCGRDRRVKRVWGESPSDAVKRLGAPAKS